MGLRTMARGWLGGLPTPRTHHGPREGKMDNESASRILAMARAEHLSVSSLLHALKAERGIARASARTANAAATADPTQWPGVVIDEDENPSRAAHRTEIAASWTAVISKLFATRGDVSSP